MLRISIIALAIGTYVLAPAPGQTAKSKHEAASAAPAPVAAGPFVVGEQLNYDVSWSDFIVAGELSIQTKDRSSYDGVDAYHVTAEARSVGVVSAFVYKINDLYDSFIDATTLKPFRAEKHSRHGKKREQTSFLIDSDRQTARLTDGKMIRIPPDTYDIASLLYAVRGIELAPGKVRSFNLLEDDKLFGVRVEPEARERVLTRMGSFDAFRLAIKLTDERGVGDPYKLRLYLNCDSRRAPILLTAEPHWGQIRVELDSSSGSIPLGGKDDRRQRRL